MPTLLKCECSSWVRDGSADFLDLVLHHPNCPCVSGVPRSHQREKYLTSVIQELCEGMVFWGNQEDGIPSECVPAYQKARFLFDGHVPVIKEE